MTEHDTAGATLEEIGAYRGRGTRGWRVEAGEFVVIEAGQAFGGEWPQSQVWQIISGKGEVRWSEPFRRIRVKEGDRYRFEPGERRLIEADTEMRILITPME